MTGLCRISCLGLLFTASQACAAPDVPKDLMPNDGWYHWQVETVQPAPDWCCHTWKSSGVQSTACDLDRRSQGFSSRDAATSGAAVMDIYARQQGGKLVDVRAYSPNCEVQSASSIAELGELEAGTSIALLQPAVAGGDDQVLAAIAVHAGTGIPVLIGIIEDRSRPFDDRSKALFWLAQSGSPEGVDYIQDLLTANQLPPELRSGEGAR